MRKENLVKVRCEMSGEMVGPCSVVTLKIKSVRDKVDEMTLSCTNVYFLKILINSIPVSIL